jgi:phage shock protein A
MAHFPSAAEILSASLDDLVRQFGEPEDVLHRVVQELQQLIAEVTENTARAIAAERRLANDLESHLAEYNQSQERAVEAIEAGNKDMICTALAQKSEHGKLVRAAERRLKRAVEASHTLQDRLRAAGTKLADAEGMLASLAGRKLAGGNGNAPDKEAGPLPTPPKKV